MARLPQLAGLLAAFYAGGAFAGAAYVPGKVPDWDQPYAYGPAPAGPGPNPTPGLSDPFDAWCAPTSAANLLGHWEDVRGVVATGDGIVFSAPPPATPPWPDGPIWHDRKLDAGRPAPGPAPAAVTDVGWYMDTNNSGDVARGNLATGHVGTFVKDIHAGLEDLLDAVVTGFGTGVRGATFAIGTESSGAPATSHPSAASAFAEAVAEVDAGRTLLIAWEHWDIVATGSTLPVAPAAPDESEFGASFYTFSATPGPDPWGNDEIWEESGDPKTNLGHVVTVVGYIKAGDPDDPNAPGMPTDWVITHDNAPGTPRNVIVPLTAAEYGSVWVSNINANKLTAVPSIGALGRITLLGLCFAIAVLLTRRRAARG